MRTGNLWNEEERDPRRAKPNDRDPRHEAERAHHDPHVIPRDEGSVAEDLKAKVAESARPVQGRGVLLMLLIWLAGTALYGGGAMLLRPDGSLLQLVPADMATSLFADFFWPGMILFTVFGIGGTIAAIAIIRRLSSGYLLAMVIGSGQIVWILAQTVLVDKPAMLQVFYLLLGVAITALASRAGYHIRPTGSV